MKLADRTVEIHSRGIDSANQFTIAQTSKMFKILSDSLYSDKVMAVIRELSTNAYDAHVAAGNKNSFKVTLPTASNPNFTVRDYGTGLSQEDMEELYTTYGASNKNDSNDFTGCLGLGSKSPFAYTKSFSTTSYFNGKAYNYIAAMDENGVPSLNLFGVTETDEPNGLEISFAVKQYDYQEFNQKAKRIYHYFKTKPIVEGSVDSDMQDHSYSYHNYVIDGDGWKVGRLSGDSGQFPSAHHNAGGVVAVMGNIAYPVSADKIIGEEEETANSNIQKWNRTFRRADVDNWKNLVREILNAGLYLQIQFDIGELEMDVSREGLQYTKGVINVLRKKTQEIYLQLKEDMTTKVAESKTLVEAYQTYYSLSDLAGGYSAGASWVDPDGKTHELSSGKDLEYKLGKHKQLYAMNFRSGTYRSRRLVYLTDKIHSETLNGKGSNYYWNASTRKDKIVFFQCDTRSAESAKKIVTKYCNLNNCFGYLMVDSENPETHSGKGFDDIIKDVGANNILKVSDYRSLLKSGTRKGRGVSGRISADEIFIISNSKDCDSHCNRLSGKALNDSDHLRELSEELLSSLEDSEQILYIPMTRYAAEEGCISIFNVYRRLLHKEEYNLLTKICKNKNVFAIKKASVAKLKKQGYNLVDFTKWIKPRVEHLVEKLSKATAKYEAIMDYCQDQYISNDETSQGRWNSTYTDRRIAYHVINMCGLNYRNILQNSKLSDLIDQWMVMEFFTNHVMRDEKFKSIKKDDYLAHMTKILHQYDLNGCDPAKIKDNHVKLMNLYTQIQAVYGAYDEFEVSVDVSKYTSKIGKMSDLRKNLQAEVDKSPMFKYIVSAVDGESIRVIGSKPLESDHYYGFKSDWYAKNDREGLGKDLGKLV
jgi:hypothetical protein